MLCLILRVGHEIILLLILWNLVKRLKKSIDAFSWCAIYQRWDFIWFYLYWSKLIFTVRFWGKFICILCWITFYMLSLFAVLTIFFFNYFHKIIISNIQYISIIEKLLKGFLERLLLSRTVFICICSFLWLPLGICNNSVMHSRFNLFL